ncbi:hypothetical protein ANN_24899 [Periplaneta americana]|uniref:Uncharacterized protein n=1 Tax=Periplaneta americana TaxID=6978 RepID=A0ABQ8S0I1_PERAM|nr:hypothetical protein ANN_24899 [Periplaneta americana]
MHVELVGRLEGKRSLERPRRRWEDNVKIDLREVGYDGMDWINLAHDRNRLRAYVRAAMNLGSLKAICTLPTVVVDVRARLELERSRRKSLRRLSQETGTLSAIMVFDAALSTRKKRLQKHVMWD